MNATRPSLIWSSAIFITCLLFYSLFWSGHHYSIDGIVMFQYAKALLFQGQWIMEPPLRWGGDFSVSKWPIGLTLLYIPVLALFSITIFAGSDSIRVIPHEPGVDYLLQLLDNRPYRYSSLINPTLTAASAVLLYMLCLRFGFSRRKAACAALVFGIASPAAVYTKFDFAQPLASFLALAGVLFFFYSQTRGRKWLFLSGTALGMSFLARNEGILYFGMPILVVLTAVGFCRKEFRLRKTTANLLLFLFPLAAFVLINQTVNEIRFAAAGGLGYTASMGDIFILDLHRNTTAVVGNLISPGRGLLVFYPLSLLSVVGIWELLKRDRRAGFLLAAIVGGALLLYSTWLQWAGGISWGPRFLIPIIPYISLLAVFGYEGLARVLPKKAILFVIVLLVLLGAMAAFQGLTFNPLEYYAGLELSDAQVAQGDYNFDIVYSPLLTGWNLQPASIDSYIFQGALAGSRIRIGLLAMIVLFLSAMLKIWVVLLGAAAPAKKSY